MEQWPSSIRVNTTYHHLTALRQGQHEQNFRNDFNLIPFALSPSTSLRGQKGFFNSPLKQGHRLSGVQDKMSHGKGPRDDQNRSGNLHPWAAVGPGKDEEGERNDQTDP